MASSKKRGHPASPLQEVPHNAEKGDEGLGVRSETTNERKRRKQEGTTEELVVEKKKTLKTKTSSLPSPSPSSSATATASFDGVSQAESTALYSFSSPSECLIASISPASPPTSTSNALTFANPTTLVTRLSELEREVQELKAALKAKEERKVQKKAQKEKERQLQLQQTSLRITSSTPRPHEGLEISIASAVPRESLLFGEIVHLSVGGQRFTTSRSTIRQYPDSYLGVLFSGRFPNLSKDSDGAIFIDRPAKHFPTVLNFMRGKGIEWPSTLDELIDLEEEFAYFQLPFPDDAFLRFPNSYAVSRMIEPPPGLPVLSEAKERYALYKSEDNSRCAVIDLFSGKQVGETVDFTKWSKNERVLMVMLTGSNARILASLENKKHLIYGDPATGEFEMVTRDPSAQWLAGTRRSGAVSLHPDGRIQGFLDHTTKKLVPLEMQSEKPQSKEQLYPNGEVLACLLQTENQAQHSFLCGWNTTTGKLIYKRLVPFVYMRGSKDCLLLLNTSTGVGELVDYATGCTVQHFNTDPMLSQAAGNFFSSTFIGDFVIATTTDHQRDLFVFQRKPNAPVIRTKSVFPEPQIKWLSSFDNRIIAGYAPPDSEKTSDCILVLAPFHHASL